MDKGYGKGIWDMGYGIWERDMGKGYGIRAKG